MEGEVIGYVWGEETNKGSKLLGLMGSMIVQLESGVIFNLSGFTNAERILTVKPERWEGIGIKNPDSARTFAAEHGKRNPGEQVPEWVQSDLFPIGSKVTFKYRELTSEGKPKEAKYWRR